MPIDPVTGSLIVAGANLVGQGANAWAQGKMNKKTRKWNEKMYWLQREHSLADWQTQADYNSPVAQMQRLKSANLNPNLVYGNGADATMNSGPRPSSVESWNPMPPQFDLGSAARGGLGMYYDMQLKDAQVQNMEKQGALIDAETLAKLAGIPKTNVDTELGKTQLEFLRQSLDVRLQNLFADLEKKAADIKFTLNANDRAELMKLPNLEKVIEEILNLQTSRAKTTEEIENLKVLRENLRKEGLLKQWEIDLTKNNLRPGDPWYIRAVEDKITQLLYKRVGGSVGAIRSKAFTSKYPVKVPVVGFPK